MKRFICYPFLFFFCCYQATSQDLAKLLDNYNSKLPQEKLYIQFDNSSYTPGQTIWYKAYLQSGNKPSFLSTNLYLDWYDAKGNLAGHIVAPVVDATASGSYTLPASFKGKTVRVLAYTKWMLNFDSSFLFQKTLAVIQKAVAGNTSVAKTEIPQTNLGFYPEGGDMVENIASMLAFKAINTAGEPVSISGSILNKEQKLVADFITTHNGMGKLSFTPATGESYTAQWKDPQGVMRNTPLPAASSSGIVLTVGNTSVSRAISIERSVAATDRFKKLTIVATMNQQVLFSASANLLEKQKIAANIPTERFPSGVLRLTVLDANRQPLAERIFFVNNDEYRTDVSLKTDTLNLEKKGKNVYQLVLPDSLSASLSVSVTDGDERFDASSNIFSGLLLSPEIKGRIYDPAYYFSSAEDEAASQLDLVMLTNGWRRFSWTDVVEGKTPGIHYRPDTSYLSIEGTVTKLKEEKISKAQVMNLMLISKDSTKQFLFAPLQPDGSFRQDNLVLFDTTTIYFRLNNKVNIPWRSKVVINNHFAQPDSLAHLSAWNEWLADTTGAARILAIETERKRVEELRLKTTLADVTVTAKLRTRMEQLDERHATGAFKTVGRTYQYNILDDKNAQSSPDIFTYLQGRIPGIIIRQSGPLGTVKVVRVERRSITGGETVVPIFLNEMLVGDNEMIKGLAVSSISYVKVIPPPFVESPNGGPGGAIAIYTISGEDIPDLIHNTPSMNLDKAEIVGYSPVRQFYSPNYAEQQPNMDEKDLRRTLLWQPNLMADKTGNKINLSFYNNDTSSSLRLVVEGVTADGKLVHIMQKLGGNK